MLYFLGLMIILPIAAIYLFMHTLPFGKKASGDRLNAIKNSPNFSKGQFQNQSFTPGLAQGTSMFSVMYNFFFKKSPLSIPPKVLPGIKTDLKALSQNENVMVWFGHSSYFLQVDGKKILVDPVFSGNASPVNFTIKSFKVGDVYTPDDIKAAVFIPIHWSKFSLALHAWDDPITRVTAEAARQQVNMKAEMIGEKITLTSANHINYWWTKL